MPLTIQMIKNSSLVGIIVLVFMMPLHAQFFEIGGFGGGLGFNGDVNEGAILSNFSAGFGGFVRYNIRPHWGISLGFIKGSLEARDRSSTFLHIRERNLSFRSNLMEFALIPQFNLLPFNPQKKGQVFVPYLGIGIAIITFNPMTKYQGIWHDLQPLGTEGQGLDGYPKKYALTAVALPLLFGIKYTIGGRLNIAIEVGYTLSFTDYLDDVSTVFVSPKELAQQGDLTVALANRTEEYTGVPANYLIGKRRGNVNNNDGYLALGLRISFNLYAKKTYKSKGKKSITPIWNKWF